MAKTDLIPHRRAYINPLPGYPEAAQRILIGEKIGPVGEVYVESVKFKRANFIDSLRDGDEAVVAHMGCLAMAHGKIDARIADLAEARGDIHAKGCVIIDAEGQRSDRDWAQVKKTVRAFLLVERNVRNGSARKYNLTDAQVRRVLEVCNMKRYTNDRQRLTALKKEGIDIGRTFMVTTVPQMARDRGIVLDAPKTN